MIPHCQSSIATSTGHDSIINEQYLSQGELVVIARDKTKKINELERKNWLLRRNWIRQSSRLRSVLGELNEKANRGDAAGVAANIISMVRSGEEKLKPVLLHFVHDLMKSATMRDSATGHGSKGVRWKKTSKQILAVFQKKGHESLVRFIRSSLEGPCDETIRRQWVMDRVLLIMGEHLSNFILINGIYVLLMSKLGIAGPVPYELEEDETHINGRLAYDQAGDAPVGACGLICGGHQCDANHRHAPLGSGVDGYNSIVDYALKRQRAFYLRVVTITPLHPRLPALPVVVHPTCQKFNCD